MLEFVISEDFVLLFTLHTCISSIIRLCEIHLKAQKEFIYILRESSLFIWKSVTSQQSTPSTFTLLVDKIIVLRMCSFSFKWKLNLSLCVLRCSWHYLEKRKNATITPFNLNVFVWGKNHDIHAILLLPIVFPKPAFSNFSTLIGFSNFFGRSVDEAWEGLGWKIDAIYWERR